MKKYYIEDRNVFLLHSNYVSNFVTCPTETFVCIICIVDIITRFNNSNVIYEYTWPVLIAFRGTLLFISKISMMPCANVYSLYASLRSPITGYDSMTVTIMPCAKSYDRRISMKMKVCDIAPLRSEKMRKCWIKPLNFFGAFLYLILIMTYIYICI